MTALQTRSTAELCQLRDRAADILEDDDFDKLHFALIELARDVIEAELAKRCPSPASPERRKIL